MKERHFELRIGNNCLYGQEFIPDEKGRGALVLLHDALGSVAQWRDFPHTLAQRTRRRVVAYDRAGYGRSAPSSERRAGDYLHRAAWEELPAVLEALAVESPVLIGHSDGGSIALLFATRHPAAALVTEAAHVWVEEATLEGIREAIAQSEILARHLEKYHGEKAFPLVNDWSGIWLSPGFRDWDIRPLLPEVRCPLLAIQGEADEFGTVRQLQAIEKGVSGPCSRLLMAGCRHIPHREEPEAVLDAITQFIGKLPS